MNHDTAELLIGITWLLWMIGFLWFFQGMLRLAKDIDGPVNQWPVPGRWLLVGLVGGLAMICADIVRLRFEPAFLEPYWSTAGPDAASTNVVLAIRVAPLIFLFWVALRVRSGGLIRGHQSSAPENAEQTERRKDLRREDDIKAYSALKELNGINGRNQA